MTIGQLLRQSFIDELRKIAADVPTRGPMRGKSGRKAQDTGDLTAGHSYGDAPEDDYTKMAEGQLHKKKGDVPSADEPRTTEISTSKSPGSKGGGMGYAPESHDEYKHAPRPDASPSVTLSNISTAIHQDELYAPSSKTAARVGLMRTDYFDKMTKEEQKLVRSQLPKNVHSPKRGVLPQMASGALTGGLMGGLSIAPRMALPLAAIGAVSQPLGSRLFQALDDDKSTARQLVRRARRKKERSEVRKAAKLEKSSSATPYLDQLDPMVKKAIFSQAPQAAA